MKTQKQIQPLEFAEPEPMEALELKHPDPIEKYVLLKQYEAQIKAEMEAVKQAALDAALEMGKIGQIGEYAGAKVQLKMVTVKPKPTPEIQQLIEEAEWEREKAIKKNQAVIARHEAMIQALKQEIEELSTTPEQLAILSEISQKMTALEGEKQPQLAVVFPKQR